MLSFTNNKLLAGQSLRFIGRAFKGFVKEQPYMVFVARLSANQILVTYKGEKLSVSRLDVQAVRCLQTSRSKKSS